MSPPRKKAARGLQAPSSSVASASASSAVPGASSSIKRDPDHVPAPPVYRTRSVVLKASASDTKEACALGKRKMAVGDAQTAGPTVRSQGAPLLSSSAGALPLCSVTPPLHSTALLSQEHVLTQEMWALRRSITAENVDELKEQFGVKLRELLEIVSGQQSEDAHEDQGLVKGTVILISAKRFSEASEAMQRVPDCAGYRVISYEDGRCEVVVSLTNAYRALRLVETNIKLAKGVTQCSHLTAGPAEFASSGASRVLTCSGMPPLLRTSGVAAMMQKDRARLAFKMMCDFLGVERVDDEGRSVALTFKTSAEASLAGRLMHGVIMFGSIIYFQEKR